MWAMDTVEHEGGPESSEDVMKLNIRVILCVR